MQGAGLQAGPWPLWSSKGIVYSLPSPLHEETGEMLIFLFFSLGTVVLDTIIPLRQLDFVGMFDSCLQTYIFLGSKLGRRLEEAPPRRERIQNVLKLLLHVLV